MERERNDITGKSDKSKTSQSVLMTQYAICKELTPRLVPLFDIHTDIKNFQGRKSPYSETSVSGIINAVLKGEFVIELMDPVRLRYNEDYQNWYLLAGHSRHEAFRRLSQEPYLSDPRVVEYKKKYKIKFDCLPSIFMPLDMLFEDAKFIALMSNSLSTLETSMERAYRYYEFRNLGKMSSEEYYARLDQYEKKNAKWIDSFSYLSLDGYVSDIVEATENGGEETVDQRKMAYRVGIAVKNGYILPGIHERELFDRLIFGGAYNKTKKNGKNLGLFANFEQFERFMILHSQKLKSKNAFSCDLSLDLASSVRIPLHMQRYAKKLRELQKDKASVTKQQNEHIRRANDKILGRNQDTDYSLFIDTNLKKTKRSRILKYVFVELEKGLEKIVDSIATDADLQEAEKRYLELRMSFQRKIKEHIDTKGSHEKQLENIQTLF